MENLYHNLNAGYFAVLSAFISIISIILAYALYSSVNHFTLYSNWISDLGRGPNGASIAFNLGMMLSSLSLFFFQYYLIRDLKKKEIHVALRKLAQISCACALIGLFFVGVFPLSLSEVLHGIAASLYFYGSFFWCITFGILEYKSKDIPKYQVFLGFVVGSFFIYYNVIAIGALIIPFITEELVMFSEWLTLFAALTWVFERGIFTLMTSSTGIYTLIITARGISIKKVIK